MSIPLRVLMVDDSADDALLLLRQLRKAGYEASSARVETAAQMRAALDENSWDIVICDYSMPRFSGPAALELLQDSGLDLPFILVSGRVGEETGVTVMTAGAHDFIPKNQPTRLAAVVERELREARQRARTRGAIEKYISRKVYDLVRAGDLDMGGDVREITVFKTDIRDFTAFAERMDPRSLIEFLNRYFTRMVRVIHRYNGEIDKYMGDAVLAKFGASESEPDHALRAVLAMTEMIQECAEFSEEVAAEGLPVIRMGIGCNTGLAVVGNLGSPDRMEYTVISDTVNTAQRIEELCKELGWELLISETTYERVRDDIEVGEPWLIQLRGQTRQTLVYPVLGRRDTVPPLRRAAYAALRDARAGLAKAAAVR